MLRPETADSKKNRAITPSTITKGLLSSLPKVNKNISLNANFDIPVPKINLKPTNLVNKLKTGGAAMKLFTKQTATRFSASYKKEDETDSVFTETVVVGYPKMRERQRTLSRDDSTIDDGSELVDADVKEEVILDSCGILATNTKQIFESPQYSFDEVETEHVKHLSKSCEESVSAIEADAILSEPEDTRKVNDSTKTSHLKTYSPVSELQKTQAKEVSVAKSDIDTKAIESKGKTVLTEKDSGISGFHCFCEEKENCPHIEPDLPEKDYMDSGPVWVLQEDEDTQDAMQQNAELNFGQKRVIDNSEADRILEKYSKSKQALHHPSLRISFSDSAISSNNATRSADQSPKSVLDLELEINTALQMKLPNLLQSSKMSRKSQRIYENLKKHIQHRLGDNECQSTIIFI